MAISKIPDFSAGSKFTIKLPQDIVGVSRYDRESQNCDWVLFSVTPLLNLADSLRRGGYYQKTNFWKKIILGLVLLQFHTWPQMDCQSPLQWVFMQQLEFGQLQMISLLVGSLKIAHLLLVSFINETLASFLLEGWKYRIIEIRMSYQVNLLKWNKSYFEYF